MKKQTKKQFTFELDDEKLKQFKTMSALAVLKWLYEANEFLQKTLTKKQKQDWKKIKHK
jgi:hypothetical protein